MDDILVRPRADYLTGDSYLWHFHLAQAGWNKLTCLDQVGLVLNVYELEGGGRVVDVYWPALGFKSINVFPSELKDGGGN